MGDTTLLASETTCSMCYKAWPPGSFFVISRRASDEEGLQSPTKAAVGNTAPDWAACEECVCATVGVVESLMQGGGIAKQADSGGSGGDADTAVGIQNWCP